jgi:hypothetical protein
LLRKLMLEQRSVSLLAIAFGSLLCLAGAVLYGAGIAEVAGQWCVIAGLPVVLGGLVFLPALRRRASPDMGTVLGFLLGGYLGGLAGVLVTVGVLAAALGGFQRIEMAAVLTCLTGPVGLLLGGIRGAGWLRESWKNGTASAPAEAPPGEAGDEGP